MRFVIDSHLFPVAVGLSGLDSLHAMPIDMIPSSWIASLACAQSLCTGHFIPAVMHMAESFFLLFFSLSLMLSLLALLSLLLMYSVLPVLSLRSPQSPNSWTRITLSVYQLTSLFVFCGQLSLVDDQRVVKYQEDYSKKAFLTGSCLTTTIRPI
jgi:hypothetical protein